MAGIYWNETEGLISLSSDGSTWITIADKNLGATQVYNDGDTLSQANCGKYYQWGNNYGFPFTGSVTTSSTQVNTSNYGPGNYYYRNVFVTGNGGNWMSNNNHNNLWGGETGTVEAMKGPCNNGFHIPSKDELSNVIAIMGNLGLSYTVDITKYLKIPISGGRIWTNASVDSDGNNGSFWTATATTNPDYSWNFRTDYNYNNCINSRQISWGQHIRPFANTPVQPDYNDTWETLYGDELPDRPIPPEPPKPKLKRIVKHNNYYYFGDKPTHASGITLNKNSITLSTTGQTEQLIATVTPEDAVNKKVLWSSSDTSIATVSSTGLVTCVEPGECTITATCADNGISTSCGVSLLDYLCFTANTAGSTVQLTKTGSPTAVTLETSTDGSTWTDYTIDDVITLANVGDKVYWRNKSETAVALGASGNYHKFMMSGSISASGDIGYLSCKNNTDTLPDYCFFFLFLSCTSLTSLPYITSTNLGNLCCYCMFQGCSNIKVSETRGGEYQTEYRIPITGTGVVGNNSIDLMFNNTGGTFTGTPTINTTYYTSNTVV